jgi:hypothetical protein
VLGREEADERGDLDPAGTSACEDEGVSTSMRLSKDGSKRATDVFPSPISSARMQGVPLHHWL